VVVRPNSSEVHLKKTKPMSQIRSRIELRSRPFALFGLALTVIAAATFLGATTNAVNGLVSPRYFITI
jgi:hypothetical protein